MKYILLILTLCVACTQSSVTKKATDREHDGFIGPVSKVSVEWSPIYRSSNDIPVGTRCRDRTDVYDESGRLTQHSVYPGTCGVDETREDYTYAKDGSRTAKTTEIRGKNSTTAPPEVAGPESDAEAEESREVIKHDASGRVAEITSMEPGGKVLYKVTYRYDAKGRMIEMTQSDVSGVRDRRLYSYIGDSRVPSGFTYVGRDGEVYERTTYSDYEYNPRGDWIKRKETSEETYNRKSISWTFREVEYFPSPK